MGAFDAGGPSDVVCRQLPAGVARSEPFCLNLRRTDVENADVAVEDNLPDLFAQQGWEYEAVEHGAVLTIEEALALAVGASRSVAGALMIP